MIFALAASILRMLRRKCARSDRPDDAFLSFGVREREVVEVGDFEDASPSVGKLGHSQVSGGRHLSPLWLLTVTGKPLGLN